MRLPNSFSQITIAQFLELQNILADNSKQWLDKYIEALSFLTGKPQDHFLDMPLEELKGRIQAISFIGKPESIPQRLRTFYIIKGRVFVLRPLTARQMNAGQYIDWMEIAKTGEGEYEYQMHKLLACVLVPFRFFRRTRYDGAKHAETAEYLLNNMSIADAYPIMLFFSMAFQESITATVDYLSLQLTKIQTEMEDLREKHLANTGGG